MRKGQCESWSFAKDQGESWPFAKGQLWLLTFCKKSKWKFDLLRNVKSKGQQWHFAKPQMKKSTYLTFCETSNQKTVFGGFGKCRIADADLVNAV